MKTDKIFEDHPNLDVIFTTSDNVPFYTENQAKNHAKTLEHKKVTKHTKAKAIDVKDVEISKSKKENK